MGACCLANFVIWACYTMKHGGCALNGTVEAGRYFFWEHAVKTGVSAAVWQFSKVYTITTNVLFVVGAFLLLIWGQTLESSTA